VFSLVTLWAADLPKSPGAFARDRPRGITNANLPSATGALLPDHAPGTRNAGWARKPSDDVATWFQCLRQAGARNGLAGRWIFAVMSGSWSARGLQAQPIGVLAASRWELARISPYFPMFRGSTERVTSFSASRNVQIVLASGTASERPSPRKRMNDRRSLIKLLGLSPWHDRTATRTGIAGQNAFSSYAADLPVPQPVPDDAVTDPPIISCTGLTGRKRHRRPRRIG
jgi:hypothetical protein